MAFPFRLSPDEATFEIAYGAIERSTSRNTPFDAARFEVPGHRWADLSENGRGVSLLNDGKYGWDVYRNRLRLTLLRSSTWPDPQADVGRHEFTYSIYPHRGDWRSADTVRRGNEVNHPLLALSTTAHAGSLPPEYSFIAVDRHNVVVSAVKRAEEGDSDELIVRVYEAQGRASTPVQLIFAGEIARADEANLLEEMIGPVPHDRHRILATLGKYEIKSFRVKLAAPFGQDTRPVSHQVDLQPYFNRDGISRDARRSDGNLDGRWRTLAAELMPLEIESEDIRFSPGKMNDGSRNVIECDGQTIIFPASSSGAIHLLGAAAGGRNQESGDFTVTYADGRVTTERVAFRDWVATVGAWGREPIRDTIAHVSTHRHGLLGDEPLRDNYLYLYSLKMDESGMPISLTLPRNRKIKLLALTLVQQP